MRPASSFAAADRRHEHVVADDVRLEPVDGRGREGDEAEVERPVAQPGDQVVGVRLGQGDLDARVALAEVAEQRRDVGDVVGGHHPHRDVAAHEARQVVDGGPDRRDRRDRGPRVRQDRLPRRRRPHAAGTVEELLTELALEAADLRAHARLRDVQPLCGAREARVVGHRDEVLELTQLHNG